MKESILELSMNNLPIHFVTHCTEWRISWNTNESMAPPHRSGDSVLRLRRCFSCSEDGWRKVNIWKHIHIYIYIPIQPVQYRNTEVPLHTAQLFFDLWSCSGSTSFEGEIRLDRHPGGGTTNQPNGVDVKNLKDGSLEKVFESESIHFWKQQCSGGSDAWSASQHLGTGDGSHWCAPQRVQLAALIGQGWLPVSDYMIDRDDH